MATAANDLIGCITSSCGRFFLAGPDGAGLHTRD
jgi:hypothetical protein